MRRTIWKYTLRLDDVQEIDMPRHAKVLSAANQGGNLCIWAEVDADMPLFPRKIYMAGTGNFSPEIPTTARFIGTVLMPPFVWHIYQE